MRIIKALFGIFIVLFLLSGALTLAVSLLGITLGVMGTIVGVIWNVVTHPVILVALVAILAWGFYRRSSSK